MALVEQLTDLTAELLDAAPEAVYARALEAAVALVAGAQAGSLARKDELGRFRFVAACGYDLAALTPVSFSLAEARFLAPEGVRSQLVRDLSARDLAMLDPERYRILQQAGRIEAIQVTLTVPIRIDGELCATLLLDNFDDPEAFAPEAQRLAELLAVLIGVALKRQRLERRTAALVAELSRLFEASLAATVILDAGSGEVIGCNASFERLSGLQRADIVGRPASCLEGIIAPSWLRTALAQLASGGAVLRDELALKAADGQSRWCLANAERLEADSCHYLLSFIDITERKLTEEDLAEAVREVMRDASWLSEAIVARFRERRALKAPPQAPAQPLSKRERAVLALIAQGRSTRQIAAELKLAEATVRNYASHIYHKIGVRSRAEALVWARMRGMGRS